MSQILKKSEVVSFLSQYALSKIAELENDRIEKAVSMDENSLSFYTKAQDQVILRWRHFLKEFQKYKSHTSSLVEDGALVHISGHPSVEWIFIYNLRTSLLFEGTKIEIDDGQLGRSSGSLHGSRPGDVVKFSGDDRGNLALSIKLLNVT